METKVIKEPYAFVYESVWEEESIKISWDDVKKSDVGTTWAAEDGDKAVNCECRGRIEFKVVYRDETGVAILHTERWDYEGYDKTVLEWFSFI